MFGDHHELEKTDSGRRDICGNYTLHRNRRCCLATKWSMAVSWRL